MGTLRLNFTVTTEWYLLLQQKHEEKEDRKKKKGKEKKRREKWKEKKRKENRKGHFLVSSQFVIFTSQKRLFFSFLFYSVYCASSKKQSPD